MSADFRPKDIGRIMDEAVVLYRRNFRTVVLAHLAVLFPAVLVGSVAMSVYYGLLGNVIVFALGAAGDPAAADAAFQQQLFGMTSLQMVAAVMVWVQFVAGAYMAGAMYRAAPVFMAGRHMGVREYLSLGLKPAVYLAITVWLVSLAVQVGSLFLLVPGFILFVRLAVAGPVVVLEDAPIDQAFKRSWALTAGRFWRVFLFWGALAIVVWSLRSAVSSPVAIMASRNVAEILQDPGAASQQLPIGWTVAVGVAGAIASTLVLPFQNLCWARFYIDLRARGEGMDLLARAGELAADER